MLEISVPRCLAWVLLGLLIGESGCAGYGERRCASYGGVSCGTYEGCWGSGSGCGRNSTSLNSTLLLLVTLSITICLAPSANDGLPQTISSAAESREDSRIHTNNNTPSPRASCFVVDSATERIKYLMFPRVVKLPVATSLEVLHPRHLLWIEHPVTTSLEVWLPRHLRWIKPTNLYELSGLSGGL